MREPVSISAVAMIVSDPPSSMLRAAPKKRFGFCSALASTPPVSTLPDAGTTVLYARASRVIESSRITTSFLCSTSRFAFSSTISATWTCRSAGSSKVEEITSPCADLRMVGRDGVGDGLQKHGLARAGRGHDEGALSLAQGVEQVQHPRGEVLGH